MCALPRRTTALPVSRHRLVHVSALRSDSGARSWSRDFHAAPNNGGLLLNGALQTCQRRVAVALATRHCAEKAVVLRGLLGLGSLVNNVPQARQLVECCKWQGHFFSME